MLSFLKLGKIIKRPHKEKPRHAKKQGRVFKKDAKYRRQGSFLNIGVLA